MKMIKIHQAINTLEANICYNCFWGSGIMDTCDCDDCDNKWAITILKKYYKQPKNNNMITIGQDKENGGRK